MRKHIQVKNSYYIWSPQRMRTIIISRCGEVKNCTPYIIEWWLHNILYYLTKPFSIFKSINIRCKDVDLIVKIGGDSDVQ